MRGHVGGFVAVGAVVAVGHAARVQTHHFSATADHVNAVTFNGHGRGHASFGPVHKRIIFPFGDDKLPEESASLFVKTHEDATVALIFGIARLAVVGANVNAAGRHDG